MISVILPIIVASSIVMLVGVFMMMVRVLIITKGVKVSVLHNSKRQ